MSVGTEHVAVPMTERRANCAVLIIDGNRTLLRELQRARSQLLPYFLHMGVNFALENDNEMPYFYMAMTRGRKLSCCLSDKGESNKAVKSTAGSKF
jgi:hypothetical protein